MGALLTRLLSWVLSGLIVKGVVLSGLVALVGLLVPQVIGLLGSFIDAENIRTVVEAIPPSVWYFLYPSGLDYGLPMIFGALVARFLIRRLPVIG